ncbi:MAG: hypothetical protein K2N72_06435, partial [Oscillospiraceae bacterium]|nr:hypothetical protein [Oscillospiraceae bacterium]
NRLAKRLSRKLSEVFPNKAASTHCPILYFLVVENIIIPLAMQIVNGLIATILLIFFRAGKSDNFIHCEHTAFIKIQAADP